MVRGGGRVRGRGGWVRTPTRWGRLRRWPTCRGACPAVAGRSWGTCPGVEAGCVAHLPPRLVGWLPVPVEAFGGGDDAPPGGRPRGRCRLLPRPGCGGGPLAFELVLLPPAGRVGFPAGAARGAV